MTSDAIVPAQKGTSTRPRHHVGRIVTGVLVGMVGVGVLAYAGWHHSHVGPGVNASAALPSSRPGRLIAAPTTTATIPTTLVAINKVSGALGHPTTPTLRAHPTAARLTAKRRATPTIKETATATVTATLPTTTTTASAPSSASQCVIALAYLKAHANPVFSQSCDPEPGAANAAQTNWADGGVSGSIVIYDPACPASYENEASNSYFDFAALPASTTSILPGDRDANSRVWDPNGPCAE